MFGLVPARSSDLFLEGAFHDCGNLRHKDS